MAQKTLTIPKLYPKQVEFVNQVLHGTATQDCFGGARGGGKSFVARIIAVILALAFPGIQILLLRKSFPELRENHIIPLMKLLNCQDKNPNNRFAIYRQADKVFVFPNGSRIVMGYCANELDVLQFQGQSYDVIFMEEATQFTEFQYDCLRECNRLSGNQTAFQPHMLFTCNPGGVGHAWIKRLFIDRNYRNKEKAENYSMTRSLVYDNDFIMDNDPDYVTKLENLPTERRKAMLEGDWDVFEGQFFSEFNPAIHVITPFKIPSDWRIFRTRDYGLDMLACYWVACDYDNNFYVYKELYEPNLIVSEAGRKINEMTKEPIYMDLAPPDLYNKNSQTGKSAVDIFYSECGHVLTKANNDRENGWLAMKEMLALRKDNQGNYKPKLFFFENCKNIIRCIPQLVYDSKKYNDCSKEPHEITHAPDAIRYLCASWTYAPIKASEIHVEEETPFTLYQKMKHQNTEGDYYDGNFD